jgi:hypothetical protein
MGRRSGIRSRAGVAATRGSADSGGVEARPGPGGGDGGAAGEGGREQYGRWREGTHDDLALAVAPACWAARKMYPNEPAGEEAYWRFKGWRVCEREFRREMERRRGVSRGPFWCRITRFPTPASSAGARAWPGPAK